MPDVIEPPKLVQNECEVMGLIGDDSGGVNGIKLLA